jgi:hypothetical protein
MRLRICHNGNEECSIKGVVFPEISPYKDLPDIITLGWGSSELVALYALIISGVQVEALIARLSKVMVSLGLVPKFI